MAGKRQKAKARKAEEARKRTARRRRLLLVAASCVAVVIAVALTLILFRHARLGRAHVHVDDGVPAQLQALFTERLAGTEGTSRIGDAEVRLSQPEDPFPASDRDLLIRQARFGDAKERIIAVDPYLIVTDQRAGSPPLEGPASTLPEMAAWLGGLDTERWTPFVVAGDNEQDFAAFTLYLAGELLSRDAYNTVHAALTEPDSETPVERLVTAMQPVIDYLRQWKAQGIVAFNWTDWDRIAVREAQREVQREAQGEAQRQAGAAATFQPRSVHKGSAWEEAFHLDPQLPPVGPQRRSFRMVGPAIAVAPGRGPRADLTPAAIDALRGGGAQHAVETESSWTPVAREQAPVNRVHRDLVRWFASAEAYVVVTERVAEHPLFDRLHQLLR